MRIDLRLAVAGLAALSLAACQESTVTSPVSPAFAVGNSMPTGKHFTLNIHGVKDKRAAMDAARANGRGRSIFVALYFEDENATNEKNKIILQPGKDFAVLDANATDSDGALFQLPQTVSGKYDVYARPLGKPGNGVDDALARLTTCGMHTVDPDPTVSGDEYDDVLCSLDNYVAIRREGKPATDLVTDDLLFLQVNVDPTATDALTTCLAGNYGAGVQTVPLFDGCFGKVFWDYDNRGLKLLQLRFYPRSGDGNEGLPE